MKKNLWPFLFSALLLCSACGGNVPDAPALQNIPPAVSAQDAVQDGLPTPEATQPKTSGTLSEDDAMLLAQNYWEISPGDADELTGFVYSILYQGLETAQENTYHCFALLWSVTEEDGSSHASTLDTVYVDTQTGECFSTLA